jgi:Peptidase family C50
MLNGYQSISSVRDEWDLHRTATKKFVRYTISPEIATLVDNLSTMTGCNSQRLLQLQYDSMLRDAAIVLSDHERGGVVADFTAVRWLQELVDSSSCSNVCRAWAYFLLGSVDVRKARISGHIRRLWDGTGLEAELSPHISSARSNFEKALHLLGSARDLLKRYVLRSLALVTGSGSGDMTTFRLVNASIGSYVDYRMTRPTSGARSGNESFASGNALPLVKDSTESTRRVLSDLGRIIQSPWRFISAALCPSGELLLAAVEFLDGGSRCSVTCVFPESGSPSCTHLFEEILHPLNRILRASQEQLSDDIPSNDSGKIEGHAKDWWNTRKQCDAELQHVLRNVERILLSPNQSECVFSGLTLGDDLNDSTCSNNESMFCENLAAKFEAADEAHGSSTRFVESDTKSIWDRNDACTFLILDEDLQAFPFEGLPMFTGRAVCRMPSLSFAHSRLMERGAPCLSPVAASFVLDPESDLPGTQDRLLPFLDSLQEKNGYHWPGVVGKPPPSSFMKEALSAKHGMLLYFGHGGGHQYLSKDQIEAWGQSMGGSLASIILMGCSSGRLESVNTKFSTSLSKLPIHYEPEGLALSYLMAGSPCVVGNLWATLIATRWRCSIPSTTISMETTTRLEPLQKGWPQLDHDAKCNTLWDVHQCVTASPLL